MEPSIQSCYKLLDISPDCTLEELKTARKELVQVWHPDRFGNNAVLQKKALSKIQEINSAYDQIIGYRLAKANKTKYPSSSGGHAVTGRESASLAAPLFPLRYRISILIGFSLVLILLLIMLSNRYFNQTEENTGFSLFLNQPRSIEIRDESYQLKQQRTERLKNKIDPFLSDLVGVGNYQTDIIMEIDAKSKMTLFTKINILINSDTSSARQPCQAASLTQINTTLHQIARLIPARGDAVEIECSEF